MKFFPVAEPDITSLEVDLVKDAVESGWVSSLGPYIEKFEVEFAKICGTKYAVSVCNGTVGLHLTLKALGIGAGDEVIVPAFTFVATAAAVLHAGATPVFVDCDSELGTMDPSSFEKAISARTKAVIPVHIYGHPCAMDEILNISNNANIKVIEDGAEAHGAIYKGKKVGSIGDAGVFSFYGNKIITTGEGGIITTNNASFDAKIRYLRDHAMDSNRRYWHTEVGYNYRITNMQAALGVAQIERFDSIISKRKKIIQYYVNSNLTKSHGIDFNFSREGCIAAPWLVCARLPEKYSKNREKIMKNLQKKGVDTRPFFFPLNQMPPYESFKTINSSGNKKLMNTDKLSLRGLNLPSSPALKEKDVSFICDAISEVLDNLV